MASIETGFPRSTTTLATSRRRRQTTERLVLLVTSVSLLFALAITFGFISG